MRDIADTIMAPPTEVNKWQTSQDGLDHLWKTTGPIQGPGTCEVLVEIHAVSLNYRDTEGEFVEVARGDLQ